MTFLQVVCGRRYKRVTTPGDTTRVLLAARRLFRLKFVTCAASERIAVKYHNGRATVCVHCAIFKSSVWKRDTTVATKAMQRRRRGGYTVDDVPCGVIMAPLIKRRRRVKSVTEPPEGLDAMLCYQELSTRPLRAPGTANRHRFLVPEMGFFGVSRGRSVSIIYFPT